MKTKLALSALVVVVAAAGSGVSFADVGHNYRGIVGEPAKASGVTRTVTVTLGDNFFTPASVQVKEGETVRFVLKNKGEFLHEFNIGTPAMHVAHQQQMATMAEHGMLTPTGVNQEMRMNASHTAGGSAMTHDDVNSVLVAPGETRQMVWKFARATELEIACNLPGHYESGMVTKVQFRR